MGKTTILTGRRAAREFGLVDEPYESEIQEQVFEYLKVCPLPYPAVAAPIIKDEGGLAINPVTLTLYDCAYIVPNGTKLGGNPAQRARYINALKKQGLKTGVSDVVIACPTEQYHGTYLELKRNAKSRVDEDQRLWAAIMRQLGYASAICAGFNEAKKFIDSIYKRKK